MTTLLALLTDVTPPNARGGAVGLYRTFMDAGGFLGPIIFMMVYSGFDPLMPFYLGFVICIVNSILIVKIK